MKKSTFRPAQWNLSKPRKDEDLQDVKHFVQRESYLRLDGSGENHPSGIKKIFGLLDEGFRTTKVWDSSQIDRNPDKYYLFTYKKDLPCKPIAMPDNSEHQCLHSRFHIISREAPYMWFTMRARGEYDYGALDKEGRFPRGYPYLTFSAGTCEDVSANINDGPPFYEHRIRDVTISDNRMGRILLEAGHPIHFEALYPLLYPYFGERMMDQSFFRYSFTYLVWTANCLSQYMAEMFRNK